MAQALTYLRELMHKVEQRQDDDSTAALTNQYIMAMVGKYHFLLDIQFVSKVLEVGLISDMPNTQPWVLGVASYQDRLLPVLDLSLWLNNSPPVIEPHQHNRLQTRWLLLQQGEEQLIFSIQSYAGLIEMDKFSTVLNADLPASCQSFVKLKCLYKQQVCYLLELKNMLDCSSRLNFFMHNNESATTLSTSHTQEITI